PGWAARVEARQGVEPGTLELVEGPEEGAGPGAESGLQPTSTPSVVLEPPPVSVEGPCPEPVWHAAPPRRPRPLRQAMWALVAVLVGTAGTGARRAPRPPKRGEGDPPHWEAGGDPLPGPAGPDRPRARAARPSPPGDTPP